MRQTLMAGAASFAHLLGRGAPKPAAAAAEDDDTKDEKDAKAKRLEDDDDGDADAEDEKDDPKAESDDPDDDGDDDKKDDAKAESDDDEKGDDKSDDDDMRKKGARSARLRERARCASIFSDAAAGKNPALAATLAFKTNMPRGQAIEVLRAGGLAIPAVAAAPRRATLDQRMAAVKTPVVGPDGAGASASADGAKTFADQVILAGKKRRGEV